MLKINEIQEHLKSINEKSAEACNRLKMSPPVVPNRIRGLLERIELINQKLNDSFLQDDIYLVEVVPIVKNNAVEDMAIVVKNNNNVILNHLSVESPFLLFNEFEFYESENSPLVGDPDFTIKSRITLVENSDLYMEIIEDKIVNSILSNERRLKLISQHKELSNLFNNTKSSDGSFNINYSILPPRSRGPNGNI